MIRPTTWNPWRFLPVFIAVVSACTGVNDVQRTKAADAALARSDTATAIDLLSGSLSNASPERYAQLAALYRSRNTIVDRLRSQQVAQAGLRRYPDHPAILLESGKTYYAQTLYPSAESCFRRLLKVNGYSCEAHYYVGLNWFRKWKHVQSYDEYLGNARNYFARVAKCNPTNQQARYRLCLADYALGDSVRAAEHCLEFIETWPENPDVRFVFGALAYDAGHYDRAADIFQTALAHLEPDERGLHTDIGLLLTDEEREEYEALAEEARQERERVFWIQRDPDPTTPLNERYVEHIYRMAMADAFYANATPPLRGWETERGRALVKFGWPSGISTTLAGEVLSGRMEVWNYATPGMLFTLFFRDEFLNGNYMVPMDYYYADAAQILFLAEPATAYIPPYVDIPAVMDVLSFRSPNGSDVYLALKVSRDPLVEAIEPENPVPLVMRTAIFDGAWQALSYRADTLRTEPPWMADPDGSPWYHLVQHLDLVFNQHHIAITLEDPARRAQALVRAEKNTIRYLGDDLQLSDVLLYPDVATAVSTLTRGGVQYPFRPGMQFATDEHLGVYVEIYNLSVFESTSEYQVTYVIHEVTKPYGAWDRFKEGLRAAAGLQTVPAPVISQTTTRRGRDYEATEDLTIDISALDPGEYILTVQVTDIRSGEQAEQQATFTKLADR